MVGLFQLPISFPTSFAPIRPQIDFVDNPWRMYHPIATSLIPQTQLSTKSAAAFPDFATMARLFQCIRSHLLVVLFAGRCAELTLTDPLLQVQSVASIRNSNLWSTQALSKPVIH